LTLAKNMVMDVSATTVAFLSKDKNANV